MAGANMNIAVVGVVYSLKMKSYEISDLAGRTSRALYNVHVPTSACESKIGNGKIRTYGRGRSEE